jgi:hypothetical protein
MMVILMVMLMVIHVVVVVGMMLRGCVRRTGKHHQEQYGGKYFLHEKNVTRARRLRKSPEALGIKRGTGG